MLAVVTVLRFGVIPVCGRLAIVAYIRMLAVVTACGSA
jgi:hypothetical protein